MIVVAKLVGAAGLGAVWELWSMGDCLPCVLMVLTLISMWYATRLYARRRAPPGGRS